MFGFEKYNKEVFNQNFIRNITFKAQYNFNKSCTAEREKFVSLLKSDFPIISDDISHEIKLEMDPVSSKHSVSVNNNMENHQVVMRTDDGQKEYILRNDLLQYSETGKTYQTSRDFDDTILKSFDFFRNVNVKEFKSLEVRKINIIDFRSNNENPDIHLSSYTPITEMLSSHLLCNYDALSSCNPYIKQNIYDLQLEDSDYTMNIKYGFIVLNREEEMKNISGQIVLDLSIQNNSTIQIENVKTELGKCHRELYNAFRWCVSNRMLDIMRMPNE